MQGLCELRDAGTYLGIDPGSFDYLSVILLCRSQWPRGQRLGPAADRLLVLRVQIPTGAWMSFVSVVCLSGRGLCDDLITRREES